MLHEDPPLPSGPRRGRRADEHKWPMLAPEVRVTAATSGADAGTTVNYHGKTVDYHGFVIAKIEESEAMHQNLLAQGFVQPPPSAPARVRPMPPMGRVPQVKAPLPLEATTPLPGAKVTSNTSVTQETDLRVDGGRTAPPQSELLLRGIPARRGVACTASRGTCGISPSRSAPKAEALPASAKVTLTTYERRRGTRTPQPYWRFGRGRPSPVESSPLQIAGVTTTGPFAEPIACPFNEALSNSATLLKRRRRRRHSR